MHFLELVYSKNYFNLAKVFVLRLIKMAKNQTECSRLDQRFLMKILVTENCKSCEINWRMLYVCRRLFTNGLNMGLPLWVEKTVGGVDTHWLSGNEKIPSVKEFMLTVLIKIYIKFTLFIEYYLCICQCTIHIMDIRMYSVLFILLLV